MCIILLFIALNLKWASEEDIYIEYAFRVSWMPGAGLSGKI